MTHRNSGAGDLHAAFEDWMVAGAAGEPARDLAVHAAHCDGCLARMAALDALAAVDPGRAPAPPARLPASSSRGVLRAGRALAGGAAVLLLAAGGGYAASGLLPASLAQPSESAPGTPAQEVLGGEGGPSAGSSRPEPSATPTAEESITEAPPSASPIPTSTAAPVAPLPVATPRPATARPTATPRATRKPAATPAPTTNPTPAPDPTPEPPPDATPSPTPVPTPTPEATPEPTTPPSPTPRPTPPGG